MHNGKEVTIYDIARKLNVSPTTVSRGLQNHPAISKKTKKKIFDLVEKWGYRSNQVARNLRQQQTKIIRRLTCYILPSLNQKLSSIHGCLLYTDAKLFLYEEY